MNTISVHRFNLDESVVRFVVRRNHFRVCFDILEFVCDSAERFDVCISIRIIPVITFTYQMR
jgi:hypothetical protein